MNQIIDKRGNIIYLIISFLVVLISYLVNINFREKLLTISLSESFFWLAVPVLVFSVIMLMVKKPTFSSWAKMTNYFFMVSILIILLTPTSTHGLDFVPIVKETVSALLAILYSIVSLVLITYKSFKKE